VIARELIPIALATATLGLAGAGCAEERGVAEAAGADDTPRLLVLGIDGMDPVLLSQLLAEGRMPSFAAVAARGAFRPLGTSIPPQSPVAWSNVICGADPGTHQIFDFIHRDPAPGPSVTGVLPYLSTSRVVAPARDWSVPLGDWRLPLVGGHVELLRRGHAFWDPLLAAGLDVTVYRMPANYPAPPAPGGGRFRCLCGMGTPDLLGTYGEFTFFSPHVPEEGRLVPGGRLIHLTLDEHAATVQLPGPENFLRRRGEGDEAASPPLVEPLHVARDPERPVARITVDDRPVLLNEGEWSDWVPVDFQTGIPAGAALGAMQLPISSRAIVRFYVKQVHPDLEIYVSPLNLDPLQPQNPIARPGDFAAELARRHGRYYTAGIPEDTKALRAGVLDEDEFLAQTRLLIDERIAQYRDALARFTEQDCLFFYFGHTDQLSHIFWRDRDPEHPGRRSEEAERYGTLIDDLYVEMDGLVGEALQVLDENDTLLILSDHGFSSFRRGFNLNTWLLRNDYLRLQNPRLQTTYRYLAGVDWQETRAYGLGLNALYLNMAGREQAGVVEPAERDALLERLREELLEIRDRDGAVVIDRVYRVDELYPGADPLVGPDLLVGYARNYRASWATAEGAMPRAVIEDNLDRWSGDHCIAGHLVPGVIVTTRPLLVDDPDLTDVAPTILGHFGVQAPPEMTGRDLFR
jgi:predicted AlkP superfamily phosphohydrolase/phosphomutase